MRIVESLFFIVLTVALYQLMVKVYKRFPQPILVPIATSTVLLIILLVMLRIPYETYMLGGRWIDELLGPAVVAFAYPLYQNRRKLKEHALSIIVSVFVGTIIGLLSGLLLSFVFQVDDALIRSLAPKSVTSPVAMDIAEIIGGAPSLAAVYVMFAGIGGAIIGPFVLKHARIHHPISMGVSLGAASHGIGTAKAYELGMIEGAISSISMTLSAVFASLLCPFIVQLLM